MNDNVENEANSAKAEPAAAPASPSRSAFRLNRITAVLLGTICAVATVCIYLLFSAGPRLQEINREQFDAARQLWKAKGPQNYNIETSVSGLRAAVYRVEVRDGKPAGATRDGSPLTDPRTHGTWSVPGMFDTMESDVEHSEDPIRVTATEVQRVSPLAQFDPQYGYPQRYRRIQWGSNLEVGWEVTRFEVVK